MSTRPVLRRALAAALALAALASSGCSKSTSPHVGGTLRGLVVPRVAGPRADVYVAGVTPDAGVLMVAIADTTGWFHFEGLAPGAYVVGARAADDAVADTVTIPSVAGNAAAETAFVSLPLAPGGVFRGLATAVGAPDPGGTTVRIPKVLAQATTGPTGAYAIGGVPVGTWTVVASRTGYASAAVLATMPAPGDTVDLPDMTLPVARAFRLGRAR